MTRAGTVRAAVVAAVALAASGALYLRAVPSVDLDAVVGTAVALVVIGGSVAFSLAGNRRHYETRARRVEAIDAALRALAPRGDAYSAGNSYQHPMIGVIRYPGRLSGSRGALSYEAFLLEGEDDSALVVCVFPVSTPKGRITPRSRGLPAEALERTRELLACCDRLEVEDRLVPLKERTGTTAGQRQLVCGTGSSKLDALLTPEALRGVIERTIALAGRLPRE